MNTTKTSKHACCCVGRRREEETPSDDRRPTTQQPLGTTANLQVTVGTQGIQRNEQNSYSEVIARLQKFQMQNNACHALNNIRVPKKRNGKIIKNPNGKPFMVHKFRVNSCLKHRVDVDNDVFVFYNEKRKKAQYGNLQTCGSVWTCPVCASRITEGRRVELKQGADKWRSQGKKMYLVTFTNSHHRGDDLADLLKGQQKAFLKIWEKTKVKNTLKDLGYRGRIVSTEVTHGSNGWHPHYHALFFFDNDINEESLQSFLAIEWKIACEKAGLKAPSIRRGVDVRDGSMAEEYISKFGTEQKWGVDREMTKSHTKKGRKDSITPFDMLRGMEDNPHYADLFREYAEVFYGKQQLTYLPRSNKKKGIVGLKQLLAVEDITDDELAEQTEKESIELESIAYKIWEMILKYKKRSEYLHAVELDYEDNGNRVQDLEQRLIIDEIKRHQSLIRSLNTVD